MIDWRAIDTVLLDMDGTLLDLHFDSHFWLEHLPRRYVELHHLDEATQETLRSRILHEKGSLNWYSLAYWSRELDVDSLELKLPITGLEAYLDAIVSSADLGVPKEAQEFWFTLQDVEPFDPERTLFIDDNPAVLESAREYGIRYLLGIRQPDSTRPDKELEEFVALDRFASILPADLPPVGREDPAHG